MQRECCRQRPYGNKCSAHDSGLGIPYDFLIGLSFGCFTKEVDFCSDYDEAITVFPKDRPVHTSA